MKQRRFLDSFHKAISFSWTYLSYIVYSTAADAPLVHGAKESATLMLT